MVPRSLVRARSACSAGNEMRIEDSLSPVITSKNVHIVRRCLTSSDGLGVCYPWRPSRRVGDLTEEDKTRIPERTGEQGQPQR